MLEGVGHQQAGADTGRRRRDRGAARAQILGAIRQTRAEQQAGPEAAAEIAARIEVQGAQCIRDRAFGPLARIGRLGIRLRWARHGNHRTAGEVVGHQGRPVLELVGGPQIIALGLGVGAIGRNGPRAFGPLAVQAGDQKLLVLGIVGDDRIVGRPGRRSRDDIAVLDDRRLARLGGAVLIVLVVAAVPITPDIVAIPGLILVFVDLDVGIEDVIAQLEALARAILQPARDTKARFGQAVAFGLRPPWRVVIGRRRRRQHRAIIGTGVIAPALNRLVAVLLFL